MIRKTHPQFPQTRRLAQAALVAAIATSTFAFADDDRGRRDGQRGEPLQVVALTADQKLITFRAHQPDKVRSTATVNGLQAPDAALIGIDYRVQDGMLYGVGDGGGIYTLDPQRGTASLIGRLTVALSGTTFGVDFNPAANALRITSDTGQNLRHPFAGATAGQTQTDGMLNYAGVVATGITGSAYVNNDLSATTATTLFAIDSQLDQVAVQSPPNAGTLSATGKLTVDTGSPVGFDIYTSFTNDVASGNSAFASLTVGGMAGFYRIDLLTGKATLVGPISGGVIDIAIPIFQD